jgi:hypothetical protein
VNHFLLVFDRSEGRLLSVTPYRDRSEALRARFQAEKLHRDNHAVEVVVLNAASEQALRRTHARYFETAGEIAGQGFEKARDVGRVVARASEISRDPRFAV